MKVPSYDDLTPSIPDISFSEGLANVARLLPEAPTSATPLGSCGVEELGSCRYACLRSVRSPQNIFSIARDFSPRIQKHGPSCIVLDVSGLGRLIGDAHAIGAELEREAIARGGNIRMAVGPTQASVRLLTLAHPGLTIAAGDSLMPVPIAILRQWLDDDPQASASAKALAAGHQKRIDTFQRWGLKTLGEIAALPAADLSERMGQEGLALQRLARGLDSAPLVPDPGVPRFVESLELEWPIDALEPLSFVLARLLDPLSASLERADRGAAAIRLDLRLVDKTTHQRVLLLPASMRDPRVLRTLLLLDLESHPPSAAIDIVTVEVDPAPSRIVQYSLLERAMPSPETLATLTARLNALVGETRCGSPMLLDTHRPDGWGLTVFNPAAVTKQRPAVSEDAKRPSRTVLRRFRPPIAVRVKMAGGRPAHVEIDRRGMPGGAVEQAAGPWRTSGAWWETEKVWDRDEWDVSFADGATCRMYRDRIGGHWFIEGVID
jgi:protein ImuB